jgi:uncharacterized membrane protein YgdD (TMEM256/DUF423 family)
MRGRALLIAGACLGFSAVALGAFGTHALQNTLSPRALEWWHTATAYQLPHSSVTMGLAFASARGHKLLLWAGWLIALGAAIFAGSLYVMALTGLTILGLITPIGGIFLLAGWATLGWAAWNSMAPPKD